MVGLVGQARVKAVAGTVPPTQSRLIMNSASPTTKPVRQFRIRSFLRLSADAVGNLRADSTPLVLLSASGCDATEAEHFAASVRAGVARGLRPGQSLDIAIKNNPAGYAAWRTATQNQPKLKL